MPRTEPCSSFVEKVKFLETKCESLPGPGNKNRNDIKISDLTKPDKPIIVIYYWHSLAGPTVHVVESSSHLNPNITRQRDLTIAMNWNIIGVYILSTEEAMVFQPDINIQRATAN